MSIPVSARILAAAVGLLRVRYKPISLAPDMASTVPRFLCPTPQSSLRWCACGGGTDGSEGGDDRSCDDLPALRRSAESLAPSSSVPVLRFPRRCVCSLITLPASSDRKSQTHPLAHC